MDGAPVEELHDLFDKVGRDGGGVGQDVISDHLNNLLYEQILIYQSTLKRINM